MNRLKGKVGVITGATSGIGRACAEKFAEVGMNLVITGRRENLLLELKEELEGKFGIKVKPLTFDVTNSIEVREKIEALEAEWKDVEVLVNNAGLALGLNKVYENKIEDIDRVIDTNVKGLLYVTNAIVPYMVKRGVAGTIINIGSVAGEMAYGRGGVYCASKAAVKMLSDGLRIDLVDTKVKVTDIKPGLVETNFSVVRFGGDKQRADSVYEGLEPLTAGDVADTVLYVANLPENIHISDLTVICNNQADVRIAHRNII